MTKKPDSEATLVELENEFRALGVHVDLASVRRVELEQRIADRKRAAAAKVKVVGMDPLEKEALKNVLDEE